MSNRATLPENKTVVGVRATPSTTTVGSATHIRSVATTGVAAAESSGLLDKGAVHNIPDGKLASFGN